MCRLPVTLGGGMTMLKVSSRPSWGLKKPHCSHHVYLHAPAADVRLVDCSCHEHCSPWPAGCSLMLESGLHEFEQCELCNASPVQCMHNAIVP